jgi:hypothetical protein
VRACKELAGLERDNGVRMRWRNRRIQDVVMTGAVAINGSEGTCYCTVSNPTCLS